MTTGKHSERGILMGLVGIILIAGLSAIGCGQTEQEPVYTDDTAQLIVVKRLIDMAQTSEAKEYVGILFPSLALGDFVEHHNDLGAWKYVVDYWPSEASQVFGNMPWFTGDFDEHFSAFNRPTWVIYDDGTIIPQGGALFVEADIAKLNKQPNLR